MTDQQPPQLDERAVRALADKLAAFTATLDPAEAAALRLLVRGGAAGDDEVQGFGWWDTTTASGWYGYLSQAFLAAALAGGMLADEQLLAQFYRSDNGALQADSAASGNAERTARPGAASPLPAG